MYKLFFQESTLKLGSILTDGQVGIFKDRSAAAMSTFGDILPAQAAGLLSSFTNTRSEWWSTSFETKPSFSTRISCRRFMIHTQETKKLIHEPKTRDIFIAIQVLQKRENRFCNRFW